MQLANELVVVPHQDDAVGLRPPEREERFVQQALAVGHLTRGDTP